MNQPALRSSAPRKLLSVSVAALLCAALAVPLAVQATPVAPSAADAVDTARGQDAWQRVRGKPAKTHNGRPAALELERLATYTLNRGQLTRILRAAPSQKANARAERGLVLSLPTPAGTFQRFELVNSPIFEAGLAAKHPDIATFRGRGIDDPTATIRADVSKLGFHASVRSGAGAWYIDPYYHLDQSLYASYFGRDLKDTDGAPFVERDADQAEVSVDKGYYDASDTVTLTGAGFAADSGITIVITDPEESVPARSVSATSDNLGAFTASFVADPSGKLDTRIVEASDGAAAAATSYQVVRDDDPTVDPPTGDVLREYRLALITEPGYAAYHGGSANVTAAKVTLMNRVTQIYEDDLSIRMTLIGNNDLLNFDTWDLAISPNGPCGAAACFTQSQVTGCSSTARARFVIGQVIGASNYDIGHLALGQPGGGIANLGVVGRQNKAGGCTGIPTPTGDFYAVDYVAHEIGHQFSGNHTFNGNQLNCSGGNRSNATSVEPGSGSSIMAYAGICLTDDLQPHSDPYFSQRSLQEISTYTSSNQAAINEVQTVALRHFGGGDEVQTVTFGPGYAPTSHVMPLTVPINAAPSATSRGGAELNGSTATIATTNVHRLVAGDVVTISGVAELGYNGTFTVTAVPTTRSFQYELAGGSLPDSGGGAVTLAEPGATQAANTVTIRTATPHGRSVGDVVTISGVTVAGYNGTFTITAVPSSRTLQYTAPVSGLAPSGATNSGTNGLTHFSPFQVQIGGSASAVVGGAGLPYNNANLTAAINAIAGFAGTVTVTGATGTGFIITFGGASAATDVASAELVNLSCGGCYASVEETNHGGPFDAFTISYDGNVSGPITNGTNYNAAAIDAAIEAMLPAGATVTVANLGGGGAPSVNGFQVTFGGTLGVTNVPHLLGVQGFTAGASGWANETDKGGAVDNKGGIITPTGNTWPAVTVPAGYTIPLRTPFALTGSAVDAEQDPMLYAWEQNDRGPAPNAAGTSLLNNTKTNGPLFAMFPVSGQISESAALEYGSAGQNHLTSNTTRTFPALYKILDNNTNAETGACPAGPIAPYALPTVRECFMEFLPTSDYVGVAGVNAAPASLHFRFTARDGEGGVNAADTTLNLASNAGPFLVNGPGGGSEWTAGSTRTVAWDVANTDSAPVSASDVRISLSLDGGWTYPVVLAESTPNDGSADIVVPNVVSDAARLKVEAVGNVFFDISNADFTVSMPGVVGLDSVVLGGKTTLVDSFDSDLGRYGTSNRSTTADLFGNAGIAVGAARVAGDVRSATGGVTIDKDGRVTGDVRAGTTIINLGTIGGTASAGSPSPVINAPPVAACSPFSGAGGISGRFTYSPATGNLSVAGGKTATLANGTYCFNNVTLSGGATLAVGGPVTIQLRGVLDASGGSLLNTTFVPANLELSSSYAGANGVILSGGGGGAYLSLYAPQTNVTLSGGASVYGAVLGRTLTVSGGSAVHYDVQLLEVWAEYFNP
jgi:Metallo-peptidase family M12B Reprolysin-like